jgi:dTDP-4-dehydrorhamnose 3,5-epimerase
VIFKQTALPGAFLIELEKHQDERGFFARSWCQREFSAHGLNPQLAQCNVSLNREKGTLRGLHYQNYPHEETKLVRCTSGAIYDVIVDLRPSSPSFKQYVGVVLSAKDHTMLYVHEGLAHGFETLQDNSEVLYQMSEFYVPEAGQGVRWNDPAFNIEWPSPPVVISERDRNYPDFVSSHPLCPSPV